MTYNTLLDFIAFTKALNDLNSFLRRIGRCFYSYIHAVKIKNHCCPVKVIKPGSTFKIPPGWLPLKIEKQP